MKFPVTITYQKNLRGLIISATQQEIALQYIKTRILENNAKTVVTNENSVSYKGTTSPFRGALFAAVDGGTFTLIEKTGKTCLIYEYSMKEMFIATSIMAIIFGIVGAYAHIWWTGPMAFLWLCGMNWLITVIRHGDLAARISIGLDDLLFDKTEEEKAQETGDKERLKSWF